MTPCRTGQGSLPRFWANWPESAVSTFVLSFFCLLGGQVVSVLLFALGQAFHVSLRLLLLVEQLAVFLLPFRFCRTGFLLDGSQFFPFCLELRLLLPHLGRLLPDFVREIPQIGEAPVTLSDAFACEQIHIPDARVAVLVGIVDELVVVDFQRVELFLEPVDLPLLGRHLVVDDGDPPVEVVDQRLPALGPLADERQLLGRGLLLAGDRLELVVDEADLLLDLALALVLLRDILSGSSRSQQGQRQQEKQLFLHRISPPSWPRPG